MWNKRWASVDACWVYVAENAPAKRADEWSAARARFIALPFTGTMTLLFPVAHTRDIRSDLGRRIDVVILAFVTHNNRLDETLNFEKQSQT